MVTKDNVTIEVFEAGDLDAAELNAEIGGVWKELMTDAATRADISREFGADEAAIANIGVPFETEIRNSGSLVAEVVLFIGGMIVNSFAGAAIDYGRDKTLDAARRVWKKYLARKVSPPGSNKLGKSKDDRS